MLFLSKSCSKFTRDIFRGEKMAAKAAKGADRAAIVLSEEEKLHLTNIARLNSNKLAVDRATILLCLGKMRYTDAVVASGKSQAQVFRVKKQWIESKLTGSDRVSEVCLRGNGRRKNDATLRNRMQNVLQFNRRLNPDTPRYARSLAIVEMAKEEGIEFSVSTVTRFLKQYEEQANIANA